VNNFIAFSVAVAFGIQYAIANRVVYSQMKLNVILLKFYSRKVGGKHARF
jgi:hypothetical protein